MNNLYNAKKGDEIFALTKYGKFTYKVKTVVVYSIEDNKKVYKLDKNLEKLILFKQSDNSIFSNFNNERFYVYCEKV